MSLYDNYSTSLVKDVPRDNIKTLINIFMIDAGVNMGNDFTETSLERTIEIVENSFRFLPVCYIASAFKKGSLGNYGPGRLVPRTINGWLNEITMEYNRDQDHKRLKEIDNSIYFKHLDKYPLGKAIIWKIDYVTEDEWDNIPLKEVAEIIGRGGIPSFKQVRISK